MAYEKKICLYCDIEFMPTHSCQKYCTKEHTDQAALQMQREKRVEAKAKREATSSWNKITKRCNELGMSYGKAVVRGLV